MPAAILAFSPPPRPKADDYLRVARNALDANDAGFRAAELNRRIGWWEEARARLVAWRADDGPICPNPVWPGATVGDVDAVLRGLRILLSETRDTLRTRLATAATGAAVGVLAATGAQAGELVATAEGLAAAGFGGALLGVVVGAVAVLAMLRDSRATADLMGDERKPPGML